MKKTTGALLSLITPRLISIILYLIKGKRVSLFIFSVGGGSREVIINGLQHCPSICYSCENNKVHDED